MYTREHPLARGVLKAHDSRYRCRDCLWPMQPVRYILTLTSALDDPRSDNPHI